MTLITHDVSCPCPALEALEGLWKCDYMYVCRVLGGLGLVPKVRVVRVPNGGALRSAWAKGSSGLSEGGMLEVQGDAGQMHKDGGYRAAGRFYGPLSNIDPAAFWEDSNLSW